jgi:hypothetical protein
MKQRILVVDGHKGCRETLRDILHAHFNAERPGLYEVETHSVPSAIESLRSLGKEDIALVIADPGNPRSTAHAFFRASKIPFIGLTCYCDEIPCYHPEKKPCEQVLCKAC